MDDRRPDLLLAAGDGDLSELQPSYGETAAVGDGVIKFIFNPALSLLCKPD